MKKILIIALIFCLNHNFYRAYAQETSRISFEDQLSWRQIKEKAKKENKFFFLDAFTTNCAPCIRMDKEIFSQKKVSDFFNENFINVKVQMDITKTDNEHVRSWYSDARFIANEYNIDSYPTFLFFDQNGELVQRTGASFNAEDFINVAATAKGTYFALKTRFKGGERDPEFLSDLLKAARLVNEKDFITLVANEYLSRQTNLLTDENIKLAGTTTKKTTDVGFSVLREHPGLADKVIGQGKSAEIISKIVFYEIALPYLRTDATVNEYGGGMVIYHGKLKDTIDWAGMKAKLNDLYPELQEHILLRSELYYYEFLSNWEKLTTTVLGNEQKIDKAILYSAALSVFSRCEDKKYIKQASLWTKGLMLADKENIGYKYLYGNLLYKSGQVKEAVKTFGELIAATGDPDGHLAGVQDKIKRGDRTW